MLGSSIIKEVTRAAIVLIALAGTKAPLVGASEGMAVGLLVGFRDGAELGSGVALTSAKASHHESGLICPNNKEVVIPSSEVTSQI